MIHFSLMSAAIAIETVDIAKDYAGTRAMPWREAFRSNTGASCSGW